MGRSPDSTDKHVGNRIRMRRLMLDLNQTALADALGVSFQQLQKYEKGTNRVGASRLQQLATLLQVPISFFFEGLAGPSATRRPKPAEASPDHLTEFLATAAGLTLCKSFMQIKSRKLRLTIVHLVEELADPLKE